MAFLPKLLLAALVLPLGVLESQPSGRDPLGRKPDRLELTSSTRTPGAG